MRYLALIVLAGLASLALAVAIALAAGPDARLPATAPVRSAFRFVDIYMDSGRVPMAAYEFELKVTAGDVRIVGVERGDARGFQDPPYYDPAALSQKRIIVGAFDTGNDLPAGKTRIARLHVYVAGAARPEYAVRVITAGSKEGKAIAATATFVEGEAK